jgi:hypothetical protein
MTAQVSEHPEVLHADDGLDEERWTALVQSSSKADVYYLPEYARATAEIEQTKPLAFVATLPSGRILAPLLIRHTSAATGHSPIEWLDASTPYGYGGLLDSSGQVHLEAFHSFFQQLSSWCSDRCIVCCVIRLHPLIGQQNWTDAAGYWQERLQIHARGITCSIGLSEWNMKLDQPTGLRRDRQADMRLASQVLRVVWGTGADDDVGAKLNIFMKLYDELIDRNGAKGFYRFPQRYFEKLAKLGKRLGIALAMHGNDPVGGNLFLIGRQYAHGHLAAANDLGRKCGASTFLIVEGARRARQLGCELLHLGGGVRPGDSLEAYKRSFGGSTHTYHYLTFIADSERFEMIRRLPHVPWPYNLSTSDFGADGE